MEFNWLIAVLLVVAGLILAGIGLANRRWAGGRFILVAAVGVLLIVAGAVIMAGTISAGRPDFSPRRVAPTTQSR